MIYFRLLPHIFPRRARCKLIHTFRPFSTNALYFHPPSQTTHLPLKSSVDRVPNNSAIHTSTIQPPPSYTQQLFTPTIASILSSQACPTEPITVQGWVTTCRTQKLNTFIHISDGSSERTLQVVVNEKIQNLHRGSAVHIEGQLQESPHGLEQTFELHTTRDQIQVLNQCDPSYPFQKKYHGVDVLRNFQHLRPKTSDFSNMLRTRSALMHAVHEYCKENDIMLIHTPILTSSQCETGGELFAVQGAHSTNAKPFFGHPTFLTVSGQLHLELFANGYPRVYTLSPCFRAEASKSTRHLAEFHMLELEFSFLNSLPVLCTLVADLLQKVVQALTRQHEQVRLDAERVSRLLRPFQCIEYREAIRYFENKGVDTHQGLTPEMEKTLSEDLNAATFIVRYPKKGKPFYMKQTPSETVENFDLILPCVGEVAGGSLRENHLETLQHRIVEEGLPLHLYQWYLDTRKYGSPEHGGFGLGFDRLVLYLLGKENIKDCIGLPRIFEECPY